MNRKIYIAYGSNLHQQQMKYRCPDAEVLGTAMLQDYELEFRGVATIVPKKALLCRFCYGKFHRRMKKILTDTRAFHFCTEKKSSKLT